MLYLVHTSVENCQERGRILISHFLFSCLDQLFAFAFCLPQVTGASEDCLVTPLPDISEQQSSELVEMGSLTLSLLQGRARCGMRLHRGRTDAST